MQPAVLGERCRGLLGLVVVAAGHDRSRARASRPAPRAPRPRPHRVDRLVVGEDPVQCRAARDAGGLEPAVLCRVVVRSSGMMHVVDAVVSVMPYAVNSSVDAEALADLLPDAGRRRAARRRTPRSTLEVSKRLAAPPRAAGASSAARRRSRWPGARSTAASMSSASKTTCGRSPRRRTAPPSGLDVAEDVVHRHREPDPAPVLEGPRVRGGVAIRSTCRA